MSTQKGKEVYSYFPDAGLETITLETPLQIKKVERFDDQRTLKLKKKGKGSKL